jgi:hypothetical protein
MTAAFIVSDMFNPPRPVLEPAVVDRFGRFRPWRVLGRDSGSKNSSLFRDVLTAGRSPWGSVRRSESLLKLALRSAAHL